MLLSFYQHYTYNNVSTRNAGYTHKPIYYTSDVVKVWMM